MSQLIAIGEPVVMSVKQTRSQDDNDKAKIRRTCWGVCRKPEVIRHLSDKYEMTWKNDLYHLHILVKQFQSKTQRDPINYFEWLKNDVEDMR